MLQAGLLCKSGLLAYGLEEGRACEVHLRCAHFFPPWYLSMGIAMAFTVLAGRRARELSLVRSLPTARNWMGQLIGGGSTNGMPGSPAQQWRILSGGVAGDRALPGHAVCFVWQSSASKIIDQPSGPFSGALDGFAAVNAGQIRISGLASHWSTT